MRTSQEAVFAYKEIKVQKITFQHEDQGVLWSWSIQVLADDPLDFHDSTNQEKIKWLWVLGRTNPPKSQ